MGYMIAVPGQQAPKIIKAEISRQTGGLVAQVPFPVHARGIPRPFQHLRQGCCLRSQADMGRLGGQSALEFPSQPVLVAARQQRGARRRTHGTVRMEIGEPHAFLGQLVQMRGHVFRMAITPQVAVTKIIGHNHNDIRGLFISGSRLPGERGQGAQFLQRQHSRTGFQKRSSCRHGISLYVGCFSF